MSDLQELEPKSVFRWFERISAIPRGSGNTRRISKFLADFGEEHGLSVQRDEKNNIILSYPGRGSASRADPIILQGHMDMVCEKTADCTRNMETDGLVLETDGNWLWADGTTLGADDGIAVAIILALLESPPEDCPPIEAVITSDEEIGMLGAQAIDLSGLRGHRLLNLDSEQEGVFIVSCAGGVCLKARMPVKRKMQNGLQYRLSIYGLTGGHSGSEIGKERANANVLLGRALTCLRAGYPLRLLSLSGGRKDNAITRSASAEFLLPEPAGPSLLSAAESIQKTFRNEYAETDPNLSLSLELLGNAEQETVVPEDSGRICDLLLTAPYGVIHRFAKHPEEVETSLNLGITDLHLDAFKVVWSIRSSVASRKESLCILLEHLVHNLGGTTEREGDYPAWEYRSHSQLRDICVQSFLMKYGREPVICNIHAGLECGILSQKMNGGFDAVSLGPDIENIHTTEERLSIMSVQRTWELLLEILSRIR